MQTLITVSDAACAYIKKMLEKEHGIGFRLSVKKTGCSGYSYLPSIVDKINPADSMIKLNEIDFYIDVTWLHLLKDLHIDYSEEEKSGLKQKRLVFTNPNESSRCGCGESFHIEK
jgi:iron-sulfur cluster assembly protein